MKKIFTYLLLIGLAALTPGCTKTVDNTASCNNGILDGTETEVDCGGTCTACAPAAVFTANLGGNAFSASQVYWTQSGSSMSIRANTPTVAIAVGLFFKFPVLNQPQVLTSASLNDNENYIIEPGDTSSITVTALDTARKLMSGTFIFHATAPPSNHISVDSGVFTNIRYQNYPHK